MSVSALVIGYGSIGQRHVKILNSLDLVSNVNILTSQKNLPFDSIELLDEIKSLNPDYIVISTPTAKHIEQLSYIEKNFQEKKVLVEKPLFEKSYSFLPKKNSVWVAYCFRFHPIIELIKKKIKGRKIWNINVFCGSFLPNWRPNRDYKDSYSASKKLGGGVLLDLSHELDYLHWFLGSLNLDYVVNDKISNLKIETDDHLILNAHSDKNTRVQLHLNYFTMIPRREIIIDGDGLSIQADIISGNAIIIDHNKEKKYDFSKMNYDDMYIKQHEAIIYNNYENLCSYNEGSSIMKVIDKVRNFDKK